ncbi:MULTISPECIES: glycosyltransferase [unclassified Ruegeria]|uniref:glycosyltransferase family protein n=1 Tax=unclassified Ruegeria TaxID=2625375 RepID=UPI0014889604|nr:MULTISPECIES: glycosyltransferase [unclassified Ruegeria]
MARQRQEGFGLADGLHYLEFLRRLHATLKPEWYFEVGTQTGASLRLSSAKTISVDPAFIAQLELIGDKPELHLFQETSDKFFASNRLNAMGVEFDLVFLDGMHLVEFLLRDFINTERHCKPDSVIVTHDCVPWNSDIAERDRITKDWTGDVWKIVPILRNYRPDLEIEVVDCAPTGLLIVSGLDPRNTALSDSYDEISVSYTDLKIEEYGVSTYFDELDLVPAEQSRWYSACPHQLAPGWQNKPDIAIKVAAPDRNALTEWGDYFFALGLAKAFSRLGYFTTIDPQDEWYSNTRPGGVDLVLKGRANFIKQRDRTCFYWAISKGIRPMNYAQADHVFWASGTMYEQALGGEMAEKSSLLPQAFDSEIIYPREQLRGKGMVFVGRNRAGFDRLSVAYAAKPGRDLKIWGPGWRNTEYESFLCGERVENNQLLDVYSSADVVLNDHTPQMRENGQTSNRIFDTLACGAVPVTDKVSWLPEDLRELVYVFEDQESFDKALSDASSETDKRRKERLEFARSMRERHSFAARARTILEVINSLDRSYALEPQYGGDT